MSERKYRQGGYQDSGSDRERTQTQKTKPAPQERGPRGSSRDVPRRMQMPGFQELLRCAMCGAVVPNSVEITEGSQCPKCSADLRCCKNCRHFDTGAQFECTEPIPERITKKDIRNECTYFVARTSIERETHDSGGPSIRPSSARSAFDNLFKK
jgi:hypothetical protein